ncbi:MAG: hemerythrin family protein [Candidatus Thiodiazotropha endolucinida]
MNRQHIQLGTQILNVAKMKNQGDINNLKERLGAILTDIEMHFSFEEDYMSRHYYPEFTEHQKGHRQVLTKAERLIDEICSGYPVVDREKVKQLSTVVFGWR